MEAGFANWVHGSCEPEAAVASWAIYTGEGVVHALRYYIQYHHRVWKYRHGFVVGSFEQFTQDLRPIARVVGGRWKINFQLDAYDHEVLSKQVFDAIEQKEKANRGGVVNHDQLPIPSSERKARRDEILAELDQPRFSALWRECSDIHGQYLELCAGGHRAEASLRSPRRE